MDLQFHTTTKQRGWKLPCALCGDLIQDGEGNVEIEKPDTAESGSRMIRVWHRACFDEFLELGEDVT